jgi:hypothetical protein
LLAVAGAVVFGVVGLRADPAVEVLAVALPVAAGSQIADADLRTVHIVADPALHVFAASQRASVVGRIAAVPLVEGSLLTAGQLGPVSDPPPGQSVIAVGVKAGRAPAGLAAGSSVVVLVVPQGAADPGVPAQAEGVVRAVDPPDNAGVTVITVQLPSGQATRIASASGDAALVLQSPDR